MPLSDEERAELLADTTLAYKKRRSAEASAFHKLWLEKLTPEQRRAYHRRGDPNRHKRKTKMRHERKRQLVELMGCKCQDCGGIFPAVCFDFHHTDPNNKTSIIAVLYQHKMETILKELEGCIMICSNCHRIRHAAQQ
jgi:hypothetical protein